MPELLRYAHLKNNEGLPREWADALLHRLEEAHDEVTYFTEENGVLERVIADLEDKVAELERQLARLRPDDTE